MAGDPHSLEVAVVQMGARRAYESALMLDEAGHLQGLYTDLAWQREPKFIGWVARKIRKGKGAVDRRTIRSLSEGKLCSTALPHLVGSICKLFGIAGEKRFRSEDVALGLFAERAGIWNSKIILSVQGNGGLALARGAHQRGIVYATEIIIDPFCKRQMVDEVRRWPMWPSENETLGSALKYEARIQELIRYSSLLLCPAAHVAASLLKLGASPERIKVVPYGLGDFIQRECAPVPKRVLFVGHAGLRKGLQYLAHAALSMVHDDSGYEFRVAGPVDAAVRKLSDCRALGFLGMLPRQKLLDEMTTADVICLPSLAEGSASVCLEGLALGIPLVVTRSAGSPIDHGVEGLIVPERDTSAIVQAVRTICEDRSVREEMSRAGARRAQLHTTKNISRQLCRALSETVAIEQRILET